MNTRKHNRNYDVLSTYNFHVPGIKGMFALLGWMLFGALLGNIASLIGMLLFKDSPDATMYSMVIAYPVMFIPPMMYASLLSRNNSLFEEGYALDNDNHFKPLGAPFCVLLVMMGTLAASFVSELFGYILPDMPEWLEDTLGTMTGGNIWIDLLCVSVFAPFFEEWLCRGEVLRGLLNFKHTDKEGNEARGLKPVWAIVISAAFFAVIHMNPWQALPAFALGCLFGYVYYKTGSLKLTMLMHFTNNTFAVLMSHVDKFQDAESMLDVMSVPMYIAVTLFCIAFLVYMVFKFKGIECQSPQGNCDKVSA